MHLQSEASSLGESGLCIPELKTCPEVLMHLWSFTSMQSVTKQLHVCIISGCTEPEPNPGWGRTCWHLDAASHLLIFSLLANRMTSILTASYSRITWFECLPLCALDWDCCVIDEHINVSRKYKGSRCFPRSIL